MVSNITLLLGREQICDILRLCGLEPLPASDYELFAAFCSSFSLLKGHKLRRLTEHLVYKALKISKPIDAESCDLIWKKCAEELFWNRLRFDITAFDLSEYPILTQNDLNTMPAFPFQTQDILTVASDFPDTSWKAWKENTDEWLKNAAQKGIRAVSFRVLEEPVQKLPSLYAVEQALKKAEKTTSDRQILCAQTLYLLLEGCQKHQLCLCLDVRKHSEATVQLLEDLQRRVKFPNVICSVNSGADPLLYTAFSGLDSRIRLAVNQKITLSDLSALVNEIPMGRIYLQNKEEPFL
jgi:hypothetical protein